MMFVISLRAAEMYLDDYRHLLKDCEDPQPPPVSLPPSLGYRAVPLGMPPVFKVPWVGWGPSLGLVC